jgi:hypothetical protein
VSSGFVEFSKDVSFQTGFPVHNHDGKTNHNMSPWLYSHLVHACIDFTRIPFGGGGGGAEADCTVLQVLQA